ncbi:hypothetical protein PROFUN_01326 [Planoprotostelium fungivorum]|uniref:Uncharacterized protein n=1 Tax=Planoprotostelium fungivorum TaxID=1890364 RepID=A0A2P6NZR5_9EUKA|nr:hypothetical protein PROFUN_01326 [Planoprotostelium fungivorum]
MRRLDWPQHPKRINPKSVVQRKQAHCRGNLGNGGLGFLEREMAAPPINPNPTIFERNERGTKTKQPVITSSSLLDVTDIFDPEHPYTLEQLKVVAEDAIFVEHGEHLSIRVMFTPTVPHCSLASTIALCLRERLRNEIPPESKLKILITPGTHSTEFEINKQINDKERVAAAMENPGIQELVARCIRDFE